MVEFPLKVSIKDLGDESALFTDYVSPGGSAVREMLSGYRRGEAVWEERLRTENPPAAKPLYERMVDYNTGLGVGDDLVQKLNLAKEGRARFVVTGQQPGVLGGPLLTLHKIETAIALADQVEKTHSVPCIPLYWMGADDTDFREIKELVLVDADLSPLVTGIDNPAHEAATPVGGISVRAVRDVFDSVEPFVEAYPFGVRIKNIVLSALDAASDHGEATARLITALTGGRVVVIDGRDPEIRRQARDLFLAYFDREEDIKAEVAARGEKLKTSGYHSQLSLGPDSGVFLLEDGRRKKISTEGREAARREMERSIDQCSPGVVLRNLVQDYVFDPVAVVLGPAEIAYRAQCMGVYEMLSVSKPVVFPRMLATYIPPPLQELLGAIAVPDVAALLTRPASFVRSVYAGVVNKEVEAAAAGFKKKFQQSANGFLESVEGEVDPALLPKLEKRLADLEHRLDRVLGSAGETGKTAALARWPFLAGIGDIVRRNEKPQDRSLSLLTPFLFGGDKAASRVSAAAEAYVTAALDDETHHIVYSG